MTWLAAWLVSAGEEGAGTFLVRPGVWVDAQDRVTALLLAWAERDRRPFEWHEEAAELVRCLAGDALAWRAEDWEWFGDV